jgi:anti-sigma regulatory factor (Ser/Thr protein kinase)
MAMTSGSFPLRDPSDVSAARRGVIRLAESIGFDENRAGQAALVATELATNILKHAKHGEILATQCRLGHHRGVEILAIDSGQGLADLSVSMRDGHSTSGSLGHGLGAVQRASNHFEVFTQPSRGMAALSRLWDTMRLSATHSEYNIGGVSVPKPGEELCGDAWSVDIGRDRISLIVADGLGHGLLASEAAAAAIEAFARQPERQPSAVLEDVHLALRPTRGAAVAICAIALDGPKAQFAGLGNIAGAVVTDNARRNFVSHNGTAGHSARHMHEFSYPMSPGAVVVMHSDGLGSQWNPADYAGLWTHDASVIAGVLYRDFTRRRDDVTVVVVRLGNRTRTLNPEP